MTSCASPNPDDMFRMIVGWNESSGEWDGLIEIIYNTGTCCSGSTGRAMQRKKWTRTGNSHDEEARPAPTIRATAPRSRRPFSSKVALTRAAFETIFANPFTGVSRPRSLLPLPLPLLLFIFPFVSPSVFYFLDAWFDYNTFIRQP